MYYDVTLSRVRVNIAAFEKQWVLNILSVRLGVYVIAMVIRHAPVWLYHNFHIIS